MLRMGENYIGADGSLTQQGRSAFQRLFSAQDATIATVQADLTTVQGDVTTLQSDVTTLQNSSRIALQTAVAAASQTQIPFTGAPSWARRVTVLFDAFSTNGTSAILVQIGDSGGIETTGYAATFMGTTGVNLPAHSDSTAGFLISLVASSDAVSGAVTLERVTGNTWVAAGVVRRNTTATGLVAGTKTLSDVLTQVRITTAGGTDTFDAGSVTISWE